MTVAAEVAAIRERVGWGRRGYGGVIEVSGGGAYDVLDRVLPCDLTLRDGQARPTLLLSEDGAIAADVLLIADEDRWLVVVEGAPVADVAEVLRAAVVAGEDARVHPTDLAAVGVDGPFAWELMSRWDTPGVVGLPYLSSYRPTPDELVVRAGRTGEYGYDVFVPAARVDALAARFAELATAFEGLETGADAAAYTALENFFFDVRADRRPELTPLELQLQWRVSRRKEFRGSAGLAARRAAGHRRVVTFRSERALDAGSAVTFRGEPVGDVLRSALSLHGPGGIGLALVEPRLAQSGHAELAVDGLALRTVSPPLVANRSLYVKPQQHTFADRADIGFPT